MDLFSGESLLHLLLHTTCFPQHESPFILQQPFKMLWTQSPFLIADVGRKLQSATCKVRFTHLAGLSPVSLRLMFFYVRCAEWEKKKIKQQQQQQKTQKNPIQRAQDKHLKGRTTLVHLVRYKLYLKKKKSENQLVSRSSFVCLCSFCGGDGTVLIPLNTCASCLSPAEHNWFPSPQAYSMLALCSCKVNMIVFLLNVQSFWISPSIL